MTVNEHSFIQKRNAWQSFLIEAKKYKEINAFLSRYDWFFIAPYFLQGFELNYILELSKKQNINKEEITKVLFRKFYNLQYTAAFMEGHCQRSNYIRPFMVSIEHSLILAYQRDYEGAVKTLMPIVEGILRKYLVSDKLKENNSSIGYKHIKNSIEQLKDEILKNHRSESFAFKVGSCDINFTTSQVNEIMSIQKEYYDIWLSFLSEFFNDSFYLNTKENEISNQLNRHAVLHEYGLDTNYNLENYLKIYFAIQFLTWLFLRKEGKPSMAFDMNDQRYRERVQAYYDIIKNSKKLIEAKKKLYQSNENFNSSCIDVILPEPFTGHR